MCHESKNLVAANAVRPQNGLASRPRRVSEIWKLDRATKNVVSLGITGIIQLNSLGSAIWIQLDGQNSIDSIVNRLTDSYPDRDPGEITRDVTEFIQYLVDNRLVILNWRPL